jgi:ABC-2 type transport system permease protein
MKDNVRIFFIGGLISYRAHFNWLKPSIFVTTLVVTPIFQILFFAFLGRSAGIESDRFFVIGNAVQVAALPGLFAMTFAITGERWSQTLAPLLASPANRTALFLGRSLPVIVNAAAVCVLSFVGAGLILHVSVPVRSLPSLALIVLVTSISCTGFGFLGGAIGLRLRDAIILINLADAVLLIFCGVNIPTATLPHWMQVVGQGLPVTHGLQAARGVADGAAFGSVAHFVLVELLVGLVYAAIGLVLLRILEVEARRHATLETT